jgi:rubrerythrin
MPVDKETAKGIETALQIEKKSFEYYHKKYKELKGNLFRQLLLFLAKQEEDHITYIGKIKKSLSRKGWPDVKVKVKSSDMFKRIKKIDHETHEIQILHIAMDFERRTKNFYLKQEKTAKGEVKKLFKRMAKYEEAHYKLLDGMYESFMYVRLET